MRANLRLPLTLMCTLGLFGAFGPALPDAAAAVLNVATTAELQSALANAQPGDIVVLAPGVYRPSAPLVVLVDLTIRGDRSAPSVIDGSGGNIILVAANIVRLETLTLRNGRTAVSWGGSGSLVLSGMTITGNTLLGVAGGDGTGPLTIVNSTIAGNRNPAAPAEEAAGIAISCGSLTLSQVTIAENDLGLWFNFPCGEDIFTIQNSLIAGNARDCLLRGTVPIGGVTSLDQDGTCAELPTRAGSVFTTRVSPGLGPLADNGGPTMTMALSSVSPAVDAGSLCAEGRDQRGAIRADGSCDVGAFERAAVVEMASTTGAGTVRITTDAGTFLSFQPVAEAAMPNQAGKPGGVTFPYGFFEWAIGLPAPGGTAHVELTFPAAVPAPPQYWKVVSGVWTDVCQQVACAVNANTLTITLQDGGGGDLDGVVNGIIVDPGGVGVGDANADLTAPEIHCEAPDGLWHATDVSLLCATADGGSGLANASDVSFYLVTGIDPGIETDNAATASRQVCDVAGNCATAGPIGGNRVDKRGPAIALASPARGATYQLGETVKADYGCSDGGSAVHGCVGPVSTGAAIDTHSVGIKTFTVQGTDNVGNQSATSFTYQVGCDYVALDLAPSTVAAGNSLRVNASLRSCSLTAQTIVLRFTFSGPGHVNGCGAVKTTMFSTPAMALPPGFNRTLSFAYRVPAGTCAGDYAVTVATLLNGVVVDTAVATLFVVR